MDYIDYRVSIVHRPICDSFKTYLTEDLFTNSLITDGKLFH